MTGTGGPSVRFEIRAVTDEDRVWVKDFILDRWAASFVVAHGVIYYPEQLPGFAAVNQDGRPLGLITYYQTDQECEIVTIDSLVEGHGLGTALLAAVKQVATAAGCRRIWLITTNDNLQALAFYQRRGFRLVAVHRDAVIRSREIKPTIPLVGNNNIPIRDEIELELPLTG